MNKTVMITIGVIFLAVATFIFIRKRKADAAQAKTGGVLTDLIGAFGGTFTKIFSTIDKISKDDFNDSTTDIGIIGG